MDHPRGGPFAVPTLGGTVVVKYKEKVKTNVYIKIPRGHYESSAHLLKFLNSKPESGVEFEHQIENGHFKVNIKDPEIENVYMPWETAYFLGFDKSTYEESAEAAYRMDSYNNISVLYVYSDIIEPSIVGNTRANLLQCCPTTGNFGQMIRQSFNPVRYVPILFDTVDSISIEILTEQGKPAQFSYGSVVLTLHIVHI